MPAAAAAAVHRHRRYATVGGTLLRGVSPAATQPIDRFAGSKPAWSRDHDRGFSSHDFVTLRARFSTPPRVEFPRWGMALTGTLARPVRARARLRLLMPACIKARVCAFKK